MTGLAPKTVTLLSAAIADETFSQPIDVRGYTHLVLYVIPNGTVSSGVVTFVETLINPDTGQPYDGTGAAYATTVSPSTGQLTATHLTVGAYSHLQARISTAIGGGGSVTVVLLAVGG